MYPVLTAAEREELTARYRSLEGEEAVEILDSPQAVQLNGGPPQAFHLDEVVDWVRPDTNYPERNVITTGAIGLFVRRVYDNPTRSISAVIFVTKDRFFRAPMQSLRNADPQPPQGGEISP